MSDPDYIKKILKKINLKNDKIIDSEFFINSNKKDLDVEYDKNIFDKSKFLYQNFIREHSVVK